MICKLVTGPEPLVKTGLCLITSDSYDLPCDVSVYETVVVADFP